MATNIVLCAMKCQQCSASQNEVIDCATNARHACV